MANAERDRVVGWHAGLGEILDAMVEARALKAMTQEHDAWEREAHGDGAPPV
jgi:hypothetical protein